MMRIHIRDGSLSIPELLDLVEENIEFFLDNMGALMDCYYSCRCYTSYRPTAWHHVTGHPMVRDVTMFLTILWLGTGILWLRTGDPGPSTHSPPTEHLSPVCRS